MQQPKNQLAQAVAQFEQMPEPARQEGLTKLVRNMVPFTGTAGIVVEKMTPEMVVMSLPNLKPVQNHIQGVHAAAMALLAETMSGIVVGLNVPDGRLPLIKHLGVDYKKRTQGGMRGKATLSPEQIQMILEQEKGEVMVDVSITDESGAEPIQCQMLWAWIPDPRLNK
jgi:acyl-coenzyme A thioesterase PaaI-like protein